MSTGTGSAPAWRPSKAAMIVTQQTFDGETSSVTLEHGTSPYTGALTVTDGKFDPQSLRALASDYLEFVSDKGNVDAALDLLPSQWLESLKPGADDSKFGWMPIGWPPKREGDDNAGDPFVSFRVERRLEGDPRARPDPHDLHDPREPQLDQTVVLQASERLDGKFIGSGFGISIIVHLPNESEAYIVGMSASLPYGTYKNGVWNTDWDDPKFNMKQLLIWLHRDEVKREIASILGFDFDSIAIRSTRLSRKANGEWEVERRGTGGARPSSVDDINYSFVFVGNALSAGTLISKVPLQAAAMADVPIFPIDPASQEPKGPDKGMRSRRPSRSALELAQYRTDAKIPAFPSSLTASDADGHELMQVVVCPDIVRQDTIVPKGSAKSIAVPAGGPLIHSDDFSAASAWQNVGQLFGRLTAYGLKPFHYFRIAKLPLRIRYRSDIRPGPRLDGNTVNACVLVDGWKVDVGRPTPVDKRPGLHMHLALADLSRRGRKPWDPNAKRAPAEPIGIAADERWIWHEIGHVLLMAGTGELEFRFAHSPGDALAAIVTDPDSYLAKPDTDLPRGHDWRGATFPWVFLPRRHDRCASHGWSWGGTLHRELAEIPHSTPPRRKAYLSEQILSSSLFRLYCCLGGDTMEDTPNDVKTRHTASHYAVFLIMQAISLLGLHSHAHSDPRHFVRMLRFADICTRRWRITYPPTGGTIHERTGGCAHKVVRWAFEAQGLYAPAGEVTNGPGLPPEVDVYIADRRPSDVTTRQGTIAYGPGNYVPVSLHWDRDQNQDGPTPAWQATEQAVDVRDDAITVRVGNRGGERATDVSVRVYWREWPADADPPIWENGAGWTLCDPPVSPVRDIDPGEEAEFDFSHQPPAGRYIVLAQADCDGDRANSNPATGLACSREKTRLVDLVSGDNNLALRVLRHP